jgi:hypothetical protein
LQRESHGDSVGLSGDEISNGFGREIIVQIARTVQALPFPVPRANGVYGTRRRR